MDSQLQNDLISLLKEPSLSEQADVQEMTTLLSNYMEEVEPAQEMGFEKVTIRRNKEGVISFAESVKLPNLRFRLKNLLIEMLKVTGAVNVATAQGKIKSALLILEFLRKARQFSAAAISAKEAETLLAIYQISSEREIVTKDRLLELLQGKLTEPEVTKALDTLADLSCIILWDATLTTEKIELNETIMIKNEE